MNPGWGPPPGPSGGICGCICNILSSWYLILMAVCIVCVAAVCWRVVVAQYLVDLLLGLGAQALVSDGESVLWLFFGLVSGICSVVSGRIPFCLILP
ncbi:unnamed protein product [Sphenostylis stenocarpa]|uniref:Uncharacterized protein n=1 Tax=Sphenostylis stenocarpa TaxID=92480 RepID=A0AA86VFR4_9FABA|nr:unnamed protein product [Sphenostylis stenocarpa]